MLTTDPAGSTTAFHVRRCRRRALDNNRCRHVQRDNDDNTYDQYGNLLTTTTPQGVTTTNTYDADGNLLTSSWTWVNPTNSDDTEAMETFNTYDGNGNLTSTKTYENGTLETSTSSTYDADNRVYSSTDDLGGVTTTVYDANGNVIQTTTPDGMVTDSVYNAAGPGHVYRRPAPARRADGRHAHRIRRRWQRGRHGGTGQCRDHGHQDRRRRRHERVDVRRARCSRPRRRRTTRRGVSRRPSMRRGW